MNEGLDPGTISSDPKQPLALNPSLITSARGHSQWMIDNDIFSHTGVNGSSPGDRMAAAGYQFLGSWGWGENIAWSGSTPSSPPPLATTAELHQDLFVDSDIDGRGHRVNLMNPNFREVGTGIAFGIFSGYNAEMATEDFAYSYVSGGDSFLTGVAYDDRLVSQDSFYTPGEGLGGVTITATRATDKAAFSTTTWSSGGYSLALPTGTYDVTASGAGLPTNITVRNVTIGTSNVEVDFTPATQVPDLALSISHSGTFKQGDKGDTYTIVVSNVGAGSTTGLVTVSDTLPAGLTPTAADAGPINGWTVSTSGQTVTATRSDALAGGASYPALTVAVDVAPNAPQSVTNTASVSGGGETNTVNDPAGDPTSITAVPALVTSVDSLGVRLGSGATFGVKLSAQPQSNVTVSVSRVSGDTDIAVAAGSSLTFTPANWNAYQQVTLSQAQEADTVEGTATIRCSASGLADKNVTACEFIPSDMNWDGIVSIIGDVPAFVQVVYHQDLNGYQQQFPGRDPTFPGDGNGDGILSIIGDVPGFMNRVYFGQVALEQSALQDTPAGTSDASEKMMSEAAASSPSPHVPVLPSLAPVSTTTGDLAGQVFYLDFDGAANVTYHGALTVGPFDVPAFQAPGALAGQEQAIIAGVLTQLETAFAGSGVSFTTQQPAAGQTYSTIYIGGAGSAFTQYGSFLGVAQQVDVGDRDRGDDAWVFTERLGRDVTDSRVLIDRLVTVITHEVGHLLGYTHVPA